VTAFFIREIGTSQYKKTYNDSAYFFNRHAVFVFLFVRKHSGLYQRFKHTYFSRASAITR